MKFHVKNLATMALGFGLVLTCRAQDPRPRIRHRPTRRRRAAPAAPAAPAPLPTPAITGPLSGLPPAIFDAGPFGKIAVNGFLSGIGLYRTITFPATIPSKPL